MPRNSASTEVITQALKEFPKHPSRTLARLVFAKNPAIFHSERQAYDNVRWIRGERKNGDGVAAKRPIASRTETDRLAAESACGMPVARDSKYIETPLPKVGTWLVVADVHVPYHDSKAIEAMLDWLDKGHGKVNGILYLGDILDCYSLSKFCRDPREVDFVAEIEATEMLFRAMDAALNPEQSIWKIGNHEERLMVYLFQHAPELFPLLAKRGLMQWDKLLNLDGLKMTVVDQCNPIRLDELWILHGHETGRGGFASPVNPARGAYLKTKACTLSAHQHRTSDHAETDIAGTVDTCWSVGCMCDLHPMYHRMANKWNHGFALINADGRNPWTIENKRIYNGKVL